jgi:4a-hydroxytetrahydrobiopterin dehydratase
MNLEMEKCEPCTGETVPMSHADAEAMMSQVPGWTLTEKSLERDFTLKDFRAAIDFINQVAEIAEKQNHHPDINISYNKVHLSLSTHKIGGLSRNDFVLAAKISKVVG